MDHGFPIVLRDTRLCGLDRFRSGRLGLVDDDDACASQVHGAGEVRGLVAQSQRVRQRDPDVRSIERPVVVASIPEEHVAFGRGLLEDGGIVDAGVHDRAFVDVRLVLLALLERALVLVEIFVAAEPLHRLAGEIAVRHRVTDDDDALVPPRAEPGRSTACRGSSHSRSAPR